MQTQIRLPEGWEVRKLGEIVELIKGRKPVKFVSKDSPNANPYILISSFEKNAHQFYTDDIKCKKCNEEDVLLVWDGARAGLSSSGHKGYIGSTIVALKQKEKIILPKFLFYFIRNHYKIFNKQIQGTGIPHLKKEYVLNLEIPIPPLPIQQKIVARLDAFFEHYNELKKEKQKAKEKYEQIIQSAIASLIPRKELPEGWKKDLLVNLCSKKPQYGYTATCVKEKVGPIYLRITDIDFKGNVDWNNVKFVDLPKEEHDKFKLEKGDIVIARTGATAGKAYLFDEGNKDMIFASYLIRFKCNQGLLLPEYLFIYMQSSLYWHHISKEQLGTGQPNINAKKLGNLEVVYPDIETQKEVINRIGTLKSNIGIITEEQKNIDFQLEQLPKAVLSKAFRGELVS